MTIIDAHMHFSRIDSFARCAQGASLVDYTRDGYLAECRRHGVVASVCMGLAETAAGAFPDADAPALMGADLDAPPPRMLLCPGINPHRLDAAALAALDGMLAAGAATGIKIYAGYYHVDPNADLYAPIYALADRHRVPVVLHCGDTFSARGLLKYAHPLLADELAVRHPGVTFVLSHLGVPWVADACEVAYKNPNVMLDLSGILVGDELTARRAADDDLQMRRFREGLAYLGDWRKVLFGTDWPLAPLGAYIDFARALVPESAREDVFFANAVRTFPAVARALGAG